MDGLHPERNHSGWIWKAAAVLFALATVLLLLWGLYLKQELDRTLEEGRATAQNDAILEFTSDFITLVLRTDGQVDFENRLKLENAVREEINNEVIFAAWQDFVQSDSEREAQENVLNLLEVLVENIRPTKAE